MKKVLSFILLLFAVGSYAQQDYYNSIDLTKTGQELYFELQGLIDNASSTFTYDDIKTSIKITDEDPSNSNKVLLVYGYDDSDGNCTTDRSRDKDAFGGGNCEYNREHVYARSLANPPMGNVDSGTTGIGADPQNVRPSDQQMNNNKGNKLFGTGSGNSGDVGSGNWYPGDEWKGDVARTMMYMYTRYGNRCLPSLAGSGPLQGTTQMLQMFLQWNVDDPVSSFEDQRNPFLEAVYGNRNPFIDNPYLATIIWGGPAAEDRWQLFGVADNLYSKVVIYPNPTMGQIWVQNDTNERPEKFTIYDEQGRIILEKNWNIKNNSIDVSGLRKGIFLLKLKMLDSIIIQRIIVK